MLTSDPEKLMVEIKAACSFRDEYAKTLDKQRKRFTGPHYHEGSSGETHDYSPENTYYEYISLMIPRLIFDNPRVQVSSRRPGPSRDVALALKYGLDRWVRDIVLRKKLVELATDMLFGYGIAMVKESVREGVDMSAMLPENEVQIPSKPTWPVVERISQKRFFMDSEAERVSDARFLGHEVRRDRADLLSRAKENPEEGWDVEVLREAAETGPKKKGTDGDSTAPTRDELVLFEVWIPEVKLKDSPGPENGFHGTIYTLCSSQGPDGNSPSGKFARAPRAYYGPRTGPYSVFGIYKVPDSPIPLSPLTAVEAQVSDLNLHVRAATRSMLNHKRIAGVNDPRTAQLVKDVGHDNVVVLPFEDGRAMVQEFEVGGQTEQQVGWIDSARERADRALGMDEALRGNVAGIGTATEHTIASEASNTRMAFIKQAFTDSVVALLEKVAFYLYHDDRIVFPLDEEVVRDMGIPPDQQPMFQGGGHSPTDGFTFEDMELEIEPYSMERSNEGLAQKRAMEMHSMLLNTLPAMQQYPDYPWVDHFSKIGNAMNAPDLAELVDTNLLERFAEDLAKQQQVQAQVARQAARPQLQSQVGTTPKPKAVPEKRPSKELPNAGQDSGKMLQAPMQQGQGGGMPKMPGMPGM
jgi:hypothetical protein